MGEARRKADTDSGDIFPILLVKEAEPPILAIGLARNFIDRMSEQRKGRHLSVSWDGEWDGFRLKLFFVQAESERQVTEICEDKFPICHVRWNRPRP